MSSKSKSILTENGVLELYRNARQSVIVQVIFLATTDGMCYLRLSDGKHVSPIVLLMKKDCKPIFSVGAVLSIQDFKVCLTNDKHYRDHSLEDIGISQVYIRKYNLVETHSSVRHFLGSLDQCSTYRDAIKHVQDLLIKLDYKVEAYIKFDAKTCKQLMAEGEQAREKGNFYFKQKDFSQAIIHYDIAKKKDCYDHRVWSNCSQALINCEQYNMAEEDALVAIKLNPFHMKAYYRAGQAALKQSKKGLAEFYARSGIFACGDTPELQQLLDSINTPKKVPKTPIPLEKSAPYIPEPDSTLITNIECSASTKSSTIMSTINKTDNDNCKGCKGANEKVADIVQTGDNSGKRCKENGYCRTGIIENVKDKEKKENNKPKAIKGEHNEKEKKIEEKRKIKEEKTKSLQERKTEETLNKQKNLLQERSVEGRRHYEAKRYKEALLVFNKVLESIGSEDGSCSTDNKTFQALQFVTGMCKLRCDMSLEGMEIMNSLLEKKSTFSNSAAAYFYLALGYEKHKHFHMAMKYTKKCEDAVKDQKSVEPIYWPASKEPIIETQVDRLKVLSKTLAKVLQEKQSQEQETLQSRKDEQPELDSKKPEKIIATAVERSTPITRCRFKNCISTQGHDGATEVIYLRDPEFKGYLDVVCEEDCTISYHPCCWKAYKESQEDRVVKLSDKDLIGTDCITPDCTGKICSIQIYDESGSLKNEISKDKKDKKNATVVKQKKKKEKKKEKPQPSKANEKKKVRNESVNEETATAELIPSKTEPETEKSRTSTKNETNDNKVKTSAEKPNLPIDPESLKNSQVIVLRPPTEREEPGEAKNTKKSKKKKNKKNKIVQPDLLGNPLDLEENNQNEYLARLRMLKLQRDAQESDSNSVRKLPLAIPTKETPTIQVLEWLDPDNPFYLPEHLRDNPKALESVLQSKANKSASILTAAADLPPESITVLLDFMYDWLKSEGPMSISDIRLRKCVEENFPPEANVHVTNCGGIKQFLMQSMCFAMIDEIICVRDHVVQAQEIIRETVMERMNSSRYLISDGLKAKKYTHLLDDEKSSCSSSSSTSQMAGSGISYVSSVLSGTNAASLRLGNGEMNNNSKNSQKCKTKGSVSGLDQLDTFDIPAASQNLNPSAPEFEPQVYEEEQDIYSDEEEHGKDSTNKEKASNPSECETAEDLEGSETLQLDEDIEDGEEEDVGTLYTENLESQLNQKQAQIQSLGDKISHMKIQMGTEIKKLRQQVEDLKENQQALQGEKDSILSQYENEDKKHRLELAHAREELKLFQTRSQSLKLQYEKSNELVTELQLKLVEEQKVKGQLREEIKNLQESLSSSSRRAHEAEVKYLSTKKDLVEAHLTRTINRLNEEVCLMSLLHQTANDDTKPDRATLSRSILAWNENIKNLREHKRVFEEEGIKLLGMVNQGRPLNVLPPGDLKIPTIPDINIASLLSSQNFPNKLLSQIAIGDQLLPGHVRPSSPQPLSTPGISKGLLPTPIGPTGLENLSFFPHNGANSLAFAGGAIPKRGTPCQPPTTPVSETPGSQKWPDSHQLFVDQVPWDFKDADIKKLFSHRYGEVVSATLYDKGRTPDGKPMPKCGLITFRNADDCAKALSVGPITVGNHALNVHPKEAKQTTKPSTLAVSSLGTVVVEPATVSGHSEYGLSDISLNASAEASKTAAGSRPPPILHPPSTTTVTKPKFQNLTSNNSVGAIGTLPPKLVRPLPRQPTSAVKGIIPASTSKEDSFTSTTSYKRLIEVCKQRVGKEYTSPEVCSALREVRIQNNKSLSGLTVDMIVDRVKAHLKARRPGSGQATLAPWAALTQCPKARNGGPDWQGPGGDSGSAPEEQCSICLEALNDYPTVPLQCQHVFHEKCIKDWLKRQSNCPNCRTFALMTDEYPSLTHQ